MKNIILALMLFATPIWAVEPDELLADPALEARAQDLDEEIRCVQCVSETIASSNADWAKDARIMVRSLLIEGQSDEEVLEFFAERYGDVALMRPRRAGVNLLLWYAGPIMLLFGAFGAWFYVRRRSQEIQPEALSTDEEKRLKSLLDD
ncbi:cytochrome c-type biogenesis protein [Cochlodiniinecator piscidefendens]|uniref:cytochrome c-type biogenesis protein n=1 Tax=Cochlodiniinecator piscidefendens TaxID=2715756 RepID=UPI00140A7310|nr:cytochrome c-type biogenesis protein [Cochlodiniinecator piscidefendens]